MLDFNLNTQSDFLDERSSDCPSTVLEAEGYCYRRTEIFFNLSEDTPFGERLEFEITVTDLWGTQHVFTESIPLF